MRAVELPADVISRLRAAAGEPQRIRELTCALFVRSYSLVILSTSLRRSRAVRSAASKWPTSTAAPMHARIFTSSPTDAGGRTIRFPLRCRDGAGGGPPAKQRKTGSTRYSTRPRPCRINPRDPSIRSIGDFYGACMDETQANALGVKPIAPMLAEIDAVSNVAGVQRMIARFHGAAIAVPFILTAGSGQPQSHGRDRADLRERAWHAGPRLLREERAAFQGRPRQVCGARREHVPAGRRQRRVGHACGGHGHADGDTLRRGFARQCCASQSGGDRSQDAVRVVAEAGASLQLGAVLRAGRAHAGRGQRQRASLSRDHQPRADRGAGRRLEDLPEVAPARQRRPFPVGCIRPRGLRVQWRLSERRHRDEAALETVRRDDR